MATNLEKATEFLSRASLLLDTSKRMEDIFFLTMKKNEKRIAVEYINYKGKIKHYRYNKFRSHSFELASALSQYLIQQPKNVPIMLPTPPVRSVPPMMEEAMAFISIPMA